ncbi:hypothetical protein GDO78_020782 [Eleutherodactylus coqui]|uniref:Distal membrane-arm assembly complex protein 1-like domain-containing protein n=1 Tax=Eleutherodactylus coqui TaxID=57060 RepID=A0A8J6BHZ0_ELECQ|nr:hypothetical protein GDO78_020782 [Eleutherodactylus coqui]
MSSTGGSASSSTTVRKIENCLSCKVVCGLGLMAAGGYVYTGARKHVRGGMPSFGVRVQIVSALGLIALGLTVLMKIQNSPPQK